MTNFDQSTKEYIKLLGMKFEVKTYLIIQLSLIFVTLCIAIACFFFVEGDVMGFKASKVGLAVFVLTLLETGELIYAMKMKRVTE